MSQTSMHRLDLGWPKTSTRTIDKCAIVPIMVCALALIVIPLIQFFNPPSVEEIVSGVARPENRIFWPAMAAISVVLAMQNRSRFAKLSWPPNIICLLAYLAFAGASVLWAFSPESSFARFAQQVMIVTSIVLPAMLASRTADMMRGLFLCFALALILNVLFVLGGTATIVNYGSNRDYSGIRDILRVKIIWANVQRSLFCCHCTKCFSRGWRRVFGAIVVAIAILSRLLEQFQNSIWPCVVCPFSLAYADCQKDNARFSGDHYFVHTTLLRRIVQRVNSNFVDRISYMLYGNSTLTGRTIIWDFVQYEIERRPLLDGDTDPFGSYPARPQL